jgi:hypothetical protein
MLAALMLMLRYAPGGDVSGIVATDSVWTVAGSPYNVVSNLTVATNVLLEIEPGVEVHIGTSSVFTVEGSLEAIGSELLRVTFGPMEGESSGGRLAFNGDLGDSSLGATGVLHNCDFGFIGANPAMLHADHTDLTLSGCNLTNLDSKAVLANDSRIAVLGNIFSDTHEGINAVRCAGTISSNSISRLFGDWDAIDLDAYWLGPGDTSIVVECNSLFNGGDDAIDINFTPAILRFNVISNFADKGISLGLGGNSPDSLEEGAVTIIANCLITECALGVAIKDGSLPRIENCTIVNCDEGVSSYEKIGGAGGGGGSLSNSIVWDCVDGILLADGSTLDVGYSDITGSDTWPGESNIWSAPSFVDGAGDFRLLPGSPCIDSGSNMSGMESSTDLDGNARLVNGTVDMGCYEFAVGALMCDVRADPAYGELPLSVELTAHVSGTNISGLIYWWDLDGDGTYDLPAGVQTVVTNVYLEVGLHDAGLMVSNSAGETVSVLKEGLVAVAGPDTVYVSLDGGHVFPYTNWSDAATNMEAALGIADYGTLVLVSNGTYDLSGELQVNGQVILQGVGGWSNTVLDAGGLSRCLALNHAGAEIDGFTVTGGAADKGAGIMLADDATVRNCLIVSNNATGRGGGVYCDGSGEILDCTIKDNTSGANGGGFYLNRGGSVDRCHIVSNRTLSAGADGGGMFIYRGGSAANSLAFGNLAQDKGGGFYCDRGGLVESCTAAGNSAQYGGGTRCYSGGTVRNTISFYNSAPNGSNNYSSASASYSYTCTAPAIAGEGNITNSPLFVALDAADLRLQRGSQCINTGIDQGWMELRIWSATGALWGLM